jgi:HSP20 family molecular chaperone IbpA
MALTYWKNLDDYLDDPWRYDRSVVPYWKRYRPWTDDMRLGMYPRHWMWPASKELLDVEHKFRDLEYKLLYEIDPIRPTFTRDGFEVTMDVKPFKPYEITVSTTENSVAIEGKHEERRYGNGSISREFKRQYTLPYGYNGNDVVSELSADGYLTIRAPSPLSIKASQNFTRYPRIMQAEPITRWNKIGNKWVRDVRFKF